MDQKINTTNNIMYKKLPVHRVFKGSFPQQVDCILLGNITRNRQLFIP
jgi:hypothetical protein